MAKDLTLALEALCRAALRGREAQVESVLAMHPGLMIQSVHAAAALGDGDALQGLLRDDPARVDAPGPFGLRPLALVCQSTLQLDRATLASELIAAGANPGDRSALVGALSRSDTELLEVLANGGAPLCSANGFSLLHYAADECWNADIVRWMLERGADPNLLSEQAGESVLYTAARRRRADAIRMLLARGARVDQETACGDRAFLHAKRRPFPEIAEQLADAGADTTPGPLESLAGALHDSEFESAAGILEGNPGLLQGLSRERGRLLADLASQGRTDAVEWLVGRGYDIEARGLDGGTPLQQCAWFATPETARCLIALGANVNARGCDHDSTPLGWVAHGSRYSGGAAGNQEAYVEMAGALLDAGAEWELPGERRPGERLLADASPTLKAFLLERQPPVG